MELYNRKQVVFVFLFYENHLLRKIDVTEYISLLTQNSQDEN